jgi:uncharacterized protein (DUF1499 family)
MIQRIREVIAIGIAASFLAACAGERPNNLGVRNGKLSDCPGSPNCVASQTADTGHLIMPLAFRDGPDAAFMRLRETLAHRSDTTIIEEGHGYLRVEFHTMLFVDDGEFLLGQGYIHVRSASRLGYSDLGKNRSRMEEIRRVFSQSETQP